MVHYVMNHHMVLYVSIKWMHCIYGQCKTAYQSKIWAVHLDIRIDHHLLWKVRQRKIMWDRHTLIPDERASHTVMTAHTTASMEESSGNYVQGAGRCPQGVTEVHSKLTAAASFYCPIWKASCAHHDFLYMESFHSALPAAESKASMFSTSLLTSNPGINPDRLDFRSIKSDASAGLLSLLPAKE